MKRSAIILTLVIVLLGFGLASTIPGTSANTPGRHAWNQATSGNDPKASLYRFDGISSSSSQALKTLPDGRMFWVNDFNGDSQTDVLTFNPDDQNWHFGSYNEGKFQWNTAGNTRNFGSAPAGCLVWDGYFNDDAQADLLFFYPGDKNWWLGSYDGTQVQWNLVANTSRFGNAPAGCLVWDDDFDGDGQDDILFFYPGDKNWWLGSYDGNHLQWSLVGNTSGFGSAPEGRPVWNGDFDGDGQADILFHNPADGNWWLGSHDGDQLRWSSAGNTSNFGNGGDGRPFWVDDFNGDGQTDVLFHYPGDGNWWLGSYDDTRLVWSFAGNTSGFGQIWGSCLFSVGDFNGDGPVDILFHHPPDGNWWLGSHNGSQLRWSSAGNTSNFGNGGDGRPFFVGDFNGDEQTDMLFYYPPDGNWWLGSHNGSKLDWSLAGNFSNATPSKEISGKVTNRGVPLKGITISLTGSRAANTITNEGGDYSFTIAAGGNYSVTPKSNHDFSPPKQSFSNLQANQIANFTVAVVTPSAPPFALDQRVGRKLVRNADGRLEVFVIGSDHGLWHIWQVAPNGGWSQWEAFGGNLRIVSEPVAIMNADGRLEVFAVAAHRALVHRWQVAPNGGWSDWHSLDGPVYGNPAIGMNADGRLEAFVIAANGSLWHKYQFAPNSGWSGWTSLKGSLASDPVIGVNADGRLEVFAVATGSALTHIWQVAPNSGWSQWSSLGGVVTSVPAVGMNADGRLEVFVRGSDYALYHKYQWTPNSGWNEWTTLGGYLTSNPVIGTNADGRLEVFVRGSDYTLHHLYQLAPNSGWSNWSTLGGYLSSSPAIGINADGRLEVVMRGSDYALYHKYQWTPNSGWNEWTTLGGYLEIF